MAITDDDWRLVSQNVIKLSVELKVYDMSDTLIDTLYGVIDGGSIRIDASSSVRRTATFKLTPTHQITNLTEKSLVWLNKNVKVRLGILDLQNNETTWYNCGSYIYQDANTQYDESTNEMTISISDWMLKLDGTVNGQIAGMLKTIVQAYQEDPTTGEPTSYNSIKDATEQVLTQLAGMTSDQFEVDEIGTYMAMPEYNTDYLAYRTKYPTWNMMPYDLEFTTGDTVFSILERLCTLFANYDFAFNENGKFVVKMIPSSYSDEVVIPYEKIVDKIISESVQTDLTSIRNICEVWGETVDAEYFADTVPMDADEIYTPTIADYDEYVVGDRFAFVFTNPSISGQLININNLGNLVIYNEQTDEVIGIGDLEINKINVFQITTCKADENDNTNREYVYKMMWQGVQQAHAVNVLTDGTVVEDGYTDSSGTYDLYSLAYYKHIMNCDNVSLTVIANSPYTVQKLGNRIDVKSGDDFENITAESLALKRAEFENWKNCRLTDTVTITTKIMPFVQAFMKASYKKIGYPDPQQYIIQEIEHNLDEGTSTITMYRFYPLYEPSIENGDLHNMTYGYMGGYTYTELYGDDDT